MPDKVKNIFSNNSNRSDKKSGDNHKNIFFDQGATVNVDPALIQKAISGGFVSELAFLIFLKGVFKNSKIYNLRRPKERIAQLTGLSIPTVNRYFNRLGFYGLIIPQPYGWNLAKIRSYKKNRISFDQDATISQIKRLLFLKVLESEGKSQALIENLFSFHRQANDANRRNEEKRMLHEPLRASLSIRYVSKLLNISEGTAIKLLRLLNSDGLLRTWRQSPAFVFADCGSDVLAHLNDNFGYRFVQNCALYKVDPATHYFPQSTHKTKPIDGKCYKKLMKNPNLRKIDAKISQLIENQYAVNFL